MSCPQIGSLSSSTANQKAAQNNYRALGCQDLYFLNFVTCNQTKSWGTFKHLLLLHSFWAFIYNVNSFLTFWPSAPCMSPLFHQFAINLCWISDPSLNEWSCLENNQNKSHVSTVNFRLQRKIYKTLQMTANFKYHSSNCAVLRLNYSFFMIARPLFTLAHFFSVMSNTY